MRSWKRKTAHQARRAPQAEAACGRDGGNHQVRRTEVDHSRPESCSTNMLFKRSSPASLDRSSRSSGRSVKGSQEETQPKRESKNSPSSTGNSFSSTMSLYPLMTLSISAGLKVTALSAGEQSSMYLQAADRGGSALGGRSSCRRPRSRPAAGTEEEGASRRAASVCKRRRRRRRRRTAANTHARTSLSPRVYLPMLWLEMM